MRKWFIVLLIFAVLAFIGYQYIYQDHRDITSEESRFQIQAHILIEEFATNSKVAEDKYLNQTIEITGLVTDTDFENLTLNNQIFCQLLEPINKLQKDKPLVIKGRFIGYDDLLEEIKLDQCSIIN